METNKLAAIKTKVVELKVDEQTLKLRFDMNAFATLEELYGTVEIAMLQLETGKVKALRDVLYAGLLRFQPGVTSQEVGEMFDLADMQSIANTLRDAISMSVPEVKQTDGAKSKGKK